LIPDRDYKPELDKYEIFEEIGHGGMATVFRGRDRRLDREVAVKVIHRHLRENREVAARFVSEARAVAKLKHPNIVEVYDVSDEADPERYLVVELVRGLTLRRLLQLNGHMPAEVAVALTLQVGAGLCTAHEHSVVHRDVKPENVLVQPPSGPAHRRQSHDVGDGRAGCVKITDFGIAKLLDAQGVTATGQVLGSPAHMAPEQIEGAEVDARADVFGLGVLLYESLVGKLPFDGKNPAQVLRRVLDGSYVPAERARPTVGSTFSRIVAKALARDAADRYQSIAELCADLRAELGQLGFDHPNRELDEYLADPKGYEREYTERIIHKLLERGRQARAARELQLAAACFNRALAFRPTDPDLTREVAGLARRERFVRIARRSAIGSGVILVSAGLVYAVTRSFAARAGAGDRTVSPQVSAERSARVIPSPVVSVMASSVPAPSAEVAGPVQPRVRAAPPRPEPTRPDPVIRRVRVLVRGASGGSVRIDGQLHSDWLGAIYLLPVGPHVFEFVPPDTECCVAPEPSQVRIEADETGSDQPQIVYGTIAFKDAVLQVNVPAGAEVTCPIVFQGTLRGATQRRVPMGRPEVVERCTVLPPPDEAAAPKRIDVTLRPGRTSYLTWP
jgi:serine/threonine-protein kinase